MSASHRAWTLPRLGLDGTLPQGDSVEAEQGSSIGKATTFCVAPVYSSATLGARVASWKPPRKLSWSKAFQVNMVFQVLRLPAVLKSDSRKPSSNSSRLRMGTSNSVYSSLTLMSPPV